MKPFGDHFDKPLAKLFDSLLMKRRLAIILINLWRSYSIVFMTKLFSDHFDKPLTKLLTVFMTKLFSDSFLNIISLRKKEYLLCSATIFAPKRAKV